VLAEARKQLIRNIVRECRRSIGKLQGNLLGRGKAVRAAKVSQRLDLLGANTCIAATGSVDVYSKGATDQTGNAYIQQEA
jgi:hypothetical protein